MNYSKDPLENTLRIAHEKYGTYLPPNVINQISLAAENMGYIWDDKRYDDEEPQHYPMNEMIEIEDISNEELSKLISEYY